ncbi:hypothetical protein N7448_011245 [Penicillium atrosanguineum]|nr:hypothetical protein N7448_011245 [Penicillium atrosanguineum]
MDRPPSPFPAGQPAKRQRRLSDQPDNDMYVQDYQPQADRTAIDPEIPVNPAGLLTTQLLRILRDNVDLAMPTLQLLDLYFCLWDCYIVKSAEKIYLDEEQQQMQESNEWLETENDVLVQRCNAQTLMLWGRERVLRDLHAGVAAVLKASGEWTCSDSDLDLHAIWRESSGIPTPPPCLTTDRASSGLASLNLAESAGYEEQGPSLVKYFFHPNREDPSGFEWTGPDPLSVSTRSEDLFLFISKIFLTEEIHWVEFRLVRLDRITGDMIGEHRFFLPRVESVMGNLCRTRQQILITISQTAVRSMASSFRLSLWPRMEPFPFPGHSTLFRPATLPTMLSLDPSFLVRNLLPDNI